MPKGFAGADILAELAPAGWTNCELVRAFNPTVKQLRAEKLALDEEFGQSDEGQLEDDADEDCPEVPFPDLDQVRAEYPGREDPEAECRDLVGRLLWEVLADDHSVIADDGRRLDLGGYDEASSVLDLFDKGEVEFDQYMEDWLDMWDRGDQSRFSCDLAFIDGRADYSPVYELIFRRMQALEMDWIYVFPKLKLYGFELPQAPEVGGSYSPAKAFADELKQREAQEECQRKQAQLDAINQEMEEEAAKQAPPIIVQAYMNVFGRRPSGWLPA